VPDSRYDAAGRVISRTMGSGAVQWQTQYTYYPWTTANGQGRLHILQSGPLTNTTLLQNLTYTYDAVGNVKTIVDGVNSNQKQCFQYDPLDRLTRATTWQDSTQGCTSQLGEPISNYSEGYDYYKGGSLKRKGAALDAADGLYTYDAGHPHAVATYRGNSYSYDAVGNMTGRVVSGVTYTLTYNAENRLTQVVSGTLTASYTYDGDGNRVRSVITAGSQVTETHYVGQHYEKTVGSGDTKYYFIAGQLVAFERSSGYGVDWGRRFVFRDHLGSTNVIINGSSGLLLWRDRYLPFGDVRDTYRKDNNPSFSLQTQYRYTGQRLEQRLGVAEGGLDRGLYFYGARWYDSSLGRFIQADTIVPQPGNPQSLNRYSYAANNPVKYRDPSGHIPCYGDGPDECSWAGYQDQPAGARRHALRGYARFLEKQVQNDGMTALDAMVGLWGFASSYGKNAVTTSDDVSYTLVGSGGTLTLLGGFLLKGKEFLGGAPLNLPNFGDTGFHVNYRDRQNQPYHFWANVNTTAQGGTVGEGIGLVANIIHEMADPTEALKTPQERGTSWEDYFLSLKGMQMGLMLRSGELTVDQAGGWMRATLSAPAGPLYDSFKSLGTAWWPSVWMQSAVDLFR
jgi:RHS repeat-associated protein